MGAEHFTEYYLPKISSGLSIIGSSIVVAEIMKDFHSGRQVRAVASILVSVSIGDILFSLAWFLGTWTAPSDLEYLDGTNHGSYASCRFQGFILTIGGLVTMLFNGLLAVFYLLMFKYNWREKRLHRLQRRIQILVWSLCLVLATVPLPLDMYHNQGPVCQIDSYPYNCTETWQLESSSKETTDCTVGDNAGFYRQIMTLFTACGTMLSSLAIFCVIYRKLKRLEDASANSSHFYSRSENENPTSENPTTSLRTSAVEEKDEERAEDKSQSSSRSSGEEDGNRESSFATQRRKRGSRIIAEEGMLYIAGFLLLFAPWAASVIVYLTSGSWNEPLDRASVFFASLIGVWNLMVFSRRRHMKTAAGRQASKLMRFRPCIHACLFCSKQSGNGDNYPASPVSKSASPVSKKKENVSRPPNRGEPQQQPAGDKSEDFVVQWKESQAQFVSELGASEICYTEPSEKWGTSPERHERDDAAPFQPNRVRSEVSSLASSDKHPGMSSSKSSHSTKDSAPFRPIRTISEASALDSIDEHSEMATPARPQKDTKDSAPFRPIRARSEDNELDSIDECRYAGIDSVPNLPLRVESQSETILDSLPRQPRRCESEIETTVEESCEHSNSKASFTEDSLPRQPRRCESEMETIPEA